MPAQFLLPSLALFGGGVTASVGAFAQAAQPQPAGPAMMPLWLQGAPGLKQRRNQLARLCATPSVSKVHNPCAGGDAGRPPACQWRGRDRCSGRRAQNAQPG